VSIVAGIWTYKKQAPPPLAGEIRADGGALFLSEVDGNGTDRSAEFDVAAASTIRITDGPTVALFEVTAASDAGTYRQLTGTWVEGTPDTPTQNALIVVEWEVLEATEPTAGQAAQLAVAAIGKATRLLVLPGSPYGLSGEVTDFGLAAIRPDYSLQEIVYGLRFKGLVPDWSSIVTADDVIRVGLNADPMTFPTDKVPDVERALLAAENEIEAELVGGVGVA
jgi:hypothetical protein